MKLLPIFILLIGATGLSAVEPPTNYLPNRYRDLARYSPFTDPVPVVPPDEKPNDLKDWTLMGVRKSDNSQIITVVNTKDRNQRIQIPSKEAKEVGFSVLEVKMARSFLNTEVHLQKGPHKGWVKYDPKFLVVKRAAAPPRGQKAGGRNNNKRASNGRGAQPPIPGSNRNSRQSNNRAQTNNRNSRTTPARPGTSARSGSNSTQTKGTKPKRKRVRYVPTPK